LPEAAAAERGEVPTTAYICDFGCGFAGAFVAVAAHEAACPQKPAAAAQPGACAGAGAGGDQAPQQGRERQEVGAGDAAAFAASEPAAAPAAPAPAVPAPAAEPDPSVPPPTERAQLVAEVARLKGCDPEDLARRSGHQLRNLRNLRLPADAGVEVLAHLPPPTAGDQVRDFAPWTTAHLGICTLD
jgi:hypothetical protein